MRKIGRSVSKGIFLAVLLTLAMGMSAFAVADYHNTFVRDDPTPGVYTPTWQGKTNSPYVKPTVRAINTTYCLTTGTSANVVSSYVKRELKGQESFRYLVGVSNGTRVRMIYYPTYKDHGGYVVEGKWQP